MTDTVLVWVLVAVLLAVALAVAAVLRLRNRTAAFAPAAASVTAPGSGPVTAPVTVFVPSAPVIPAQRAAGVDEPRWTPTPPAGIVEVPPADPVVEPPADPAMSALDPRTPVRGVASLAADVLIDALRREGPFEGSVLPGGDGTTASDPAYRIKASTATRRYYRPESPYYQRTRAELWFRTVADAQRAGFTG